MSKHITVKGQIPEGENGWSGNNSPVTEIKVVNMLDDIGKLVLHLGDASVAMTPKMWDVVLNCLVDAVGPTRSVKLPAPTIAQRLDAAAAVDDNGQAFGAVLGDFITGLGASK